MLARQSHLSFIEREVLEQIYVRGVIWDDQLASIAARDELCELGLARRKTVVTGTYTVLTQRGLREALDLGYGRHFEAQ